MEHATPPHPAIRLLDQLATERIGPVVPKTMVFDRLLDLRNLVGDNPSVIASIDDRLRAVPGATMAPGDWWQSELKTMRATLSEALCPEGVG